MKSLITKLECQNIVFLSESLMENGGIKMSSLLKIDNLSTGFLTESGMIRAIENVSFQMKEGEVICIVGESGSGKSVTALSILRLLEFENGRTLNGKIIFEGEDLLTKSKKDMREIRGGKISMVFQDPMTSLNPVFTIGKQITEAILLHKKLDPIKAKEEAIELLRLVGVSDPRVRINQYPFELSGGMLQRVMIAIALACNPKLLIADEPTTALDVSVEAQILDLLRELKSKLNMSIMMITHDIGVAAEMADRIVVMYAGTVMEEGTVYDIFENPHHPYTIGLLQSIPDMETDRSKKLPSINGTIPSILHLPSGCRFHPRCSFATDQCRIKEPPIYSLGSRRVACWNYEEVQLDKKQYKEVH